MWVRHTLVATTLGAAVLAASGSGTATSAAGYRAGLDAACALSWAFTQSLPELQLRKHLSVHQLRLLANQEGARFHTAVSHLVPPAGLAAANRRLAADLEDTPADSRAALTTFARTLLKDYEVLGATRCAADERKELTSLGHLHS